MSWTFSLIRVDSDPTWPSGAPANWVGTSEPLVYQYAEWQGANPPGIITDPALSNPQVIGVWTAKGVSLGHDNAAYEAIRPLGNDFTGEATADLHFDNFQGHETRELGTGGGLYPDTNSPLRIRFSHKYFGGNPNPDWDGWGWEASVDPDHGSRDPGVHAVAIYRDKEFQTFWYQTGAFVLQGDGTWKTEYNPGLLGEAQAQKVAIPHEILEASLARGNQILEPNQDFSEHLYWEGTRPPPESSTWNDTGITVLSLFSANIYRVDDTAALALLPQGSLVRVGTTETTFVGVWSGSDDLMQINPHVTWTVPGALEVFS